LFLEIKIKIVLKGLIGGLSNTILFSHRMQVVPDGISGGFSIV
jgi:hypothetical protein